MNAINFGGPAGLCYPVPEKWMNQLMRRDYIIEMCDRFINH